MLAVGLNSKDGFRKRVLMKGTANIPFTKQKAVQTVSS